MNKYSVLILYPESVADSYGESYYAHVEAENPDKAIQAAIAECMPQNGWSDENEGVGGVHSSDFVPVLVLSGHITGEGWG